MKHFVPLFFLALLLSYCSTAKNVQETDEQQANFSVSDSLSAETIFNAKDEYMRGLEQFELENYEAALDHLTAAYIKMPENSGINYALADAYLQKGDLVNAAYYGKQAAEKEPSNKWYHLKLAEIYRKSGKNEATISELKKVLKYHPDDINVMFQLANTYSQYGDYLKSNEMYNRILSVNGPDPNIHLQKFKNFDALNMRDSSIKELKAMQKLDPDNLNTLQTLSEYYMDGDQPAKAKQVLRGALDRNPRDPQTLVMLSDIYIDEAQWDSAGTLLSTVISDSLVPPHGKLQIARYLYSRFKKDENNPQLKQETGRILDLFTQTNPDFGIAHALAADFYSTIHKPEKALHHLAETNKLQPENDTAWRQRLQILFVQQQYNQVIEIGQKADKYAPEDPFIMFFVGSSYLFKKEQHKAVDWLSRASKLPARKPFKSVIYGSLGDAQAAVDHWDKADEAYENALKYDPDNDNAMNNYAYYLSNREKNLEYAKKLALKALKLKPDNASYLDTAGWIFYKLGDYEQAKEYIQKSVNTGQASAVVMEHLGDVYKKLGDPEKAKEWWKKALKKDSSKKHLKQKISDLNL